MAGLVPAIHAAPLRTTFEVRENGSAYGRMLRIRLGMAGLVPAMTSGGCKDSNNCNPFR
jgi:hypothetical protein